MKQNFRRVQKLSHSLLIGIPDEIAKRLNITKGDMLAVSLKENKIVVESLDTLSCKSDSTVASQPIKEMVSHE